MGGRPAVLERFDALLLSRVVLRRRILRPQLQPSVGFVPGSVNTTRKSVSIAHFVDQCAQASHSAGRSVGLAQARTPSNCSSSLPDEYKPNTHSQRRIQMTTTISSGLLRVVT